MRIALALLFAVSTAVFADTPVVIVQPACPEWTLPTAPGQQMTPPTITVHYNPNASADGLKSGNQLSLILAETGYNRFDSRTIPMVRSNDGTWNVTYSPQKNYVFGYSMFFFRDENGRVDNNGSRYWDFVNCYRSQPSEMAVNAQALTYEGRLLAPGIQRARDLGRAINILQPNLTKDPTALMDYPFLWRAQLGNGQDAPAAAQQVGQEIKMFLSAYGNDAWAMRQVTSIIAASQDKLPPDVIDRFRAALIALPKAAILYETNMYTKERIPVTRNSPAGGRLIAPIQKQVQEGLENLEYWSIKSKYSDPHKKAEAYLAFAGKYPNTSDAYAAYGDAFYALRASGDVAGAEAVFEKWLPLNPHNPSPQMALARMYINQKIKPARALELLDQAEKIYTENARPSSPRYQDHLDFIQSLRAQAQSLLNNSH